LATRERSSGTAGDAQVTPAPAAPAPAPGGSGSPGSTQSRSPGTLRLDDKSAAASLQPGAHIEASVVFGPWLCSDEYTWDLGHPVLAQPCHAVAPDQVRIIGHMEALPGVQADVHMSVFDADTDELADGPHVCKGLMFTDFDADHDCGPFVTRLPRGHRYIVAQKWVYTGRAILPGGEVRGQAFDW
jgi:hypothetical protein